LRGPVDAFFENVMVMADDVRVRANRLALLAALQRLFLHIANLSDCRAEKAPTGCLQASRNGGHCCRCSGCVPFYTSIFVVDSRRSAS
jgi:hypothetical protein